MKQSTINKIILTKYVLFTVLWSSFLYSDIEHAAGRSLTSAALHILLDLFFLAWNVYDFFGLFENLTVSLKFNEEDGELEQEVL